MELSLVAMANATPYAICGYLAVLRRLGHLRSWPLTVLAGSVIYALIIAVAPVGAWERTNEGQGWYAASVLVVGIPSWIAICLGYLTWLIWDGRIGRTIKASDRRPVPLQLAVVIAISGVIPWGFLLFQLPGGLVWALLLAALPMTLFLLMMAVSVSDRAPTLLIPRDLRAEAAPSVGNPFWVDVLAAITTLAPGAALVVWLMLTVHWGRPAAVLVGGALSLIVAFAFYTVVDKLRGSE